MKVLSVAIASAYTVTAVVCAFYGMIVVSLFCIVAAGVALTLLKEKKK